MQTVLIHLSTKEKSILTWDNLSYKEGEQEEILKNIKKELKA